MKKKIFAFLALSALALGARAYEVLWLATPNDKQGVKVADAKEIRYSDDKSNLIVEFNSGATAQVPILTGIDAVPGRSDGSIDVNFSASGVEIENPLAFDGVAVTKDDERHVAITCSTGSEVTIRVSGTTSQGQVKVYGNDPVRLELYNAAFNNVDCSALSFQTQANVTLVIKGNATITDNQDYDSTNGDKEKAAIYALGNLAIQGTSTLTVSSLYKHAICAEGSIKMESGTVLIPSSVSDGLHSEGFVMTGGSLTVQGCAGDAIDAGAQPVSISGGEISCTVPTVDTKGIKSDSNITISGGKIKLNAPGDQVKALKSKLDIIIKGGEIEAETSGNAVVVDGDPSYCTAIKADGNLTVDGGSIIIKTSGKGGKGISVDGNATFNAGTIDITCQGDGTLYTMADGTTDAYSSTCITADGDLNLLGGTFTLVNKGSAGKCIKVDGVLIMGSEGGEGPNVTGTTSGAKITVSTSSPGATGPGGPGGGGGGWGPGMDNGDYSNPKVVKAVGNLTVNSGTYKLSSTKDGGEGLESKAVLTINGGDIKISTIDDCINAASHIQINGGALYCVASNNDAIDSNGTLTIAGGITTGATYTPGTQLKTFTGK